MKKKRRVNRELRITMERQITEHEDKKVTSVLFKTANSYRTENTLRIDYIKNDYFCFENQTQNTNTHCMRRNWNL
jgi:hypothetical protein